MRQEKQQYSKTRTVHIFYHNAHVCVVMGLTITGRDWHVEVKFMKNILLKQTLFFALYNPDDKFFNRVSQSFVRFHRLGETLVMVFLFAFLDISNRRKRGDGNKLPLFITRFIIAQITTCTHNKHNSILDTCYIVYQC